MVKSIHGPSGIGGWLILPMFGLILTPVWSILHLVSFSGHLFRDGAWQEMTTPGSEFYDPMWAPLIIFDFVESIAMAVFAMILLIFMVKELKLLPRLMILFYLLNLAFPLITQILHETALPEDVQDADYYGIIKTLISTIIWVSYFKLSKRVKNTFVQ